MKKAEAETPRCTAFVFGLEGLFLPSSVRTPPSPGARRVRE